MALVDKTYTFTGGTTIVASEHNSNFDTLFNDYNGNITDSNISYSANIADSKLAQITTASKVHGTAITGLASVPSGAGELPEANLESTITKQMTFTDLVATTADIDGGTLDGVQIGGTTATGELIVNNSSDEADGLGSQGTAGQVLTSAGTGANPTWEDTSGNTEATFSVYANAFACGNGNYKVVWTSEDFDTGSDFDTATNDRFVAPSTGYYLFTANGVFDTGTGAFQLETEIKKNGTAFTVLGITSINTSNTTSVSGSIIMYLTSSQYVELWLNTESAGTSTFTGRFTGMILS